MATCARCEDEFELAAEWHRTFTESTGERVTLVYRSVVCDDCLSESELGQREKWAMGDPIDPALMALHPSPEQRVSEAPGV